MTLRFKKQESFRLKCRLPSSGVYGQQKPVPPSALVQSPQRGVRRGGDADRAEKSQDKNEVLDKLFGVRKVRICLLGETPPHRRCSLARLCLEFHDDAIQHWPLLPGRTARPFQKLQLSNGRPSDGRLLPRRKSFPTEPLPRAAPQARAASPRVSA